MKIVITGNPNYSGLCSGLKEMLVGHELTFLSRSNGYDLTNIDQVVEAVKGYDVFINSTNVPNNGQLKILDAVYNDWTSGHIINISTTSVYWNNQSNLEYYQSKLKLEQRSKHLSNFSVEHGLNTRVSCIAFGELDTSSQQMRNDGRSKMMLLTAAMYVKMIVESPTTININYVCVDPIQIKN